MPRSPLAAILVLALALPARAQSNPSLANDFNSMTFWLAHGLAQGLAFNAGSNFDPPREVKGYYLQPDVSLGVGRMPLDKREFPTLTVPALQDQGGSNIFPNTVLFPNLALHLRMGLPWRGDMYVRFADATTPPGYKISPTMTAKVQTNSFGAGIRQHFFGGDWPTLTLGAHYNHVTGGTRLKGKFGVNTSGFTADSALDGDIKWNVNSFGLTGILSYTWGNWTPFAGMGYNYATGTVSTALLLHSQTFLVSDVYGAGSDRPEKSQGREIFGCSYDRPTWSVFGNAEIKALGQLQYRSFIAQIGAALPFDIGRGPAIIYKRRQPASVTPAPVLDDEPAPKPKTRPRTGPKPEEKAPPEMIFLQ